MIPFVVTLAAAQNRYFFLSCVTSWKGSVATPSRPSGNSYLRGVMPYASNSSMCDASPLSDFLPYSILHAYTPLNESSTSTSLVSVHPTRSAAGAAESATVTVSWQRGQRNTSVSHAPRRE